MPRRKTHAEFVAEVEALVGAEYSVVGKYKNSYTKIKIKHVMCENIYDVRPKDFLKGSRCAKCYEKTRGDANRLSHSEFLRRVEEMSPQEYDILGVYKNGRTKLPVTHKICGFTWSATPSNFIKNPSCPRCSRRKSHEDFMRDFSKVHDVSEYEFLERYEKGNRSIKFLHIPCGNEHTATPSSLLSGTGCPHCAYNFRTSRTKRDFFRNVKELFDGEVEILGDYVNVTTPVLMKNRTCGHVFSKRPTNIKKGCAKCPVCANRMTDAEYTERFNTLHKGEYIKLSKYTTSSGKIMVKHSKCGHEWLAIASGILGRTGCPKCKQSKGEAMIHKFLERIGVLFSTEYTATNCIDKRSLPFDFALYNDDRSLKCLIEYDGEHHFFAVEGRGGVYSHDMTKRHDAIKTKYCADHNIPLIRIPYWDFDNIDEILTKELRKLDVITTQKIAS